MAIWPDNEERYQSRLVALRWLCANFHAFMNQRASGEPIITLRAPMWGGMPIDDYPLGLSDLENIRDSMLHIFDLIHSDPDGDTRYSITIDDLLEYLNWSFNPVDIEDLKIQYQAPKDPSKLPKTKRKHNKS